MARMVSLAFPVLSGGKHVEAAQRRCADSHVAKQHRQPRPVEFACRRSSLVSQNLDFTQPAGVSEVPGHVRGLQVLWLNAESFRAVWALPFQALPCFACQRYLSDPAQINFVVGAQAFACLLIELNRSPCHLLPLRLRLGRSTFLSARNTGRSCPDSLHRGLEYVSELLSNHCTPVP